MAIVVQHVLVLFLIFVFPLWDRRETRRLKRASDPHARIRSYQKTIAWQWLAVFVLLAAIAPGRLFVAPAVGFDLAPLRGLAIGVLAGLFIGAALAVVLARVAPQVRERQLGQLESLAFFLPQTGQERRWFAAVSITAGICEEIIFRGFLIRYVEALPLGLGLVGAIIVAALIFGLDHGYQGWTGMLTTTLLGLVMTALFLLSGSLWVPMLVHALLDLRVLLLVPKRAAE